MRKKLMLMLISLSILLFAGLPLFAACGEEGYPDSGWVPETEQSNVFDDGCYLLADFETFDQCTQILWAKTFGKVIRIDNGDYITHGNWSVKLEIAGTEEAWGKVAPYAKIATNAQYFQKKDFTDCDAFLFDMYSEMDYDLNILFCIGEYNSANSVAVTLKPGWNNVEIPIASEDSVSPGSVYLPAEGVSSFCFVFDRGELHAATQTVYFDNFRAHKTV